MIGKALAHYEITGLLGKGGMGEVYLASDSRLKRQVAIKVLPSHLSGELELIQRFEREARTISGLNHPNICTLYDVGQQDGIHYLVMEHLDGETLAVRLARGPIPLGEALKIATQIADALDKAHRSGVMHRDLKPGNIMLTSTGAKLLDFGLAKNSGTMGGTIASMTLTQTSPLTADGSIVGTFQYMSPEQLEAKPLDARSDIFSFGAVLYEMITGRRAFEASSQASLIVGIMSGEPPRVSTVAPTSPAALDRVVQRCLAKNPDERWHSAADLAAELRWIAGDSSSGARAVEATVPTRRINRERMAWLASVVVLLALVAGFALRRPAPTPLALTRTSIMPPPGLVFDTATPFAVSSDGRKVAFVVERALGAQGEDSAKSVLWVRDFADAEPRSLGEIKNAAYPFWSPDGRWIGFFGGGKLNKIDVRGGPVIPICDAQNGRGGTWNRDGIIVFQREWNEGLMRVSAGGGTPEALTTLDAERFDIAHRWPQFLRNGRDFLFYLVSTTNPTVSEHAGVYVGSLDSDEVRFLFRSESRAMYAQGHLIYRAGATLMARPFDVDKLQLGGDPTPISSDIPGGAISWGGAHFGVSQNGILVHLLGSDATNTELHWYDREGNSLGTVGESANYWDPALSHDDERIAVSIGFDSGDIWIHDLTRELRTRLSFESTNDTNPIWSPDDSQIAFASTDQLNGQIYIRPTSGREQPKVVHTVTANLLLTDWSRDGRYLLYADFSLDGGFDLWAYDLVDGVAKVLTSGTQSEVSPMLSPDGGWLAYASAETGRREIYLQNFPEASGRWMVSSEGGQEPSWRSDGREMYFLDAENYLVAVEIITEPALQIGKPVRLFAANPRYADSVHSYAVSSDGQRFLVNERPPRDPSKLGARMIQNWVAAITP